jgi:hypothetical protein
LDVIIRIEWYNPPHTSDKSPGHIKI